MSAIVIRYDSPLPSCANLREHWRKRAARVKEQRYLAWLQGTARNLFGLLGGRDPLPGITVTLCRVSARALDDDNLASAFKAVRDGVADALGIKDNDPRVSWAYEQRRGAKGERSIEIRIEAKKARAA